MFFSLVTKKPNTKLQMSADFFCCHFYLKRLSSSSLFELTWQQKNFVLHLVFSIWLLVIRRSNEKNRTYLWELWGKTLGFSFFHDMTTIVNDGRRKKTYILQSLFSFFLLTTFLLNSKSFFQINSYKNTHVPCILSCLLSICISQVT